MRERSTEFSNAAWCNSNTFISLTNDLLNIFSELGKRDKGTKRNDEVNEWQKELTDRMVSRINTAFIKGIGVLGKFIRSDDEGYIHFEEEEWVILYAMLFPEDGLVPLIVDEQKEKITTYINNITTALKSETNSDPKPSARTGAVLEDLIWGQLFKSYQTRFNKDGDTDNARTRNKISKELIHALPLLAALAFTPITLSERDNVHYKDSDGVSLTTPPEAQLASLLKGIEQGAAVLISTKKNKTTAERFTYDLKAHSTLFKAEFTICKLSEENTALKEENRRLKGLLPKPPKTPAAMAHLSTSVPISQESINTLISDFIAHHEKLSIYRQNIFGWALGIKGAHVKEREALLKDLRTLWQDNKTTPLNKKTRFEQKLGAYIKQLEKGHSRRNLVDIHQFLTGKMPSPKVLQNMWTHGFLDLSIKVNYRLANPMPKAMSEPTAPTIS